MRAWANQRVPGHDGTPLALDVHLPEESTWPVPAVVTRTAYGRTAHLAEGRAWRRAGFAFVAQDVRGRYDSEGTWTPYRDERGDGARLVDHLLAQPWCDGRVVAYGGSYAGYTAWALAVERPEAVRAVISLGPSLGLHRTKFAPGGILRLTEHVGWWLERADGRTSRPGLREVVFTENPDLLDHLPVVEIGDLSGVDLPHWNDALDLHEEFGRDGTPPEAVTTAELEDLTCATFHAGGWYDLLTPEAVDLWRVTGSAVAPRPLRRLVLGPWEHDLGMDGGTTVGVLDHGPGSRRDWGSEFVAFARDALEGTGASGADVFRSGRWRRTPDWPTTGFVPWFPAADGTLRPEPSVGDVGFRSDPHDPFPSLLAGQDRSATSTRQDAVRFWSNPLVRDVVFDGLAEIDLDTAGEGDWICRLLHERSDGSLVELAVATTTAHEATFTPMSCGLPAGTRWALEITGSDFPHLARNLGPGVDRLRGEAGRPVEQVVRCAGTVLRVPAGEPAGESR
ncbi:CocE/NonD family hydrolase [Kineococcus sp. LSe6-4]|uniref:CocE/NonD family hydrolase n=1 Tax=Kineococcus halophytocola TaxID=3234027 RepID=A0ABV4H5Z1_9ACTN